MKKYSISVILPVYNNGSSLKELYSRLKKVLEKISFSYEILFVNDASLDNSSKILEELSLDSSVMILFLEKNQGQNRALLQGMKKCTKEIIILMDADLQDPPEIIPQIVSQVKEGYGAVFAGRRGYYESYFRLLTSKVFKYLLCRLCNLPRDAGLFVAMDQKTAKLVEKISMKKPFIVAMIGLSGCRTRSIPFIREKQKESKTAYTFWLRLKVAFSALYSVIRLKRSLKQREKQKSYYAKSDHGNIFPENYPKHIQRIVEKSIETISLDSQEKILEVGCGMGRFTIPFFERGYDIEGLDLSSDLLQQIQRYLKKDSFFSTYSEDLLHPPSHLLGKYDVVLGFFVLHHLPDLEQAFKAVSSLLKPKGKFLFIEPNPYNILYYLQIFFHPKMRWKEERHMLKMRPSFLNQALPKKCHLKVKRFGFFPPLFYEKWEGIEKFLEKIPFSSPFLPYQIFYGKKKL